MPSAILFVAVFFFWLPAPAFGYVDPGTGLFVLQGVVSVIIGGVFLARQGIRNVINTVLRRKRDEPDDAADETGNRDGES